MAKRRRVSRRTTRSRKRSRRSFKRRGLKLCARKQIFATRRFVGGKVTLTGSDAVPDQYGACTFSLGDVPSYSEFTALFDQYKIAGVSYRWVISRDPMVATTKNYPRLTWVHDYDDDATPSATSLPQYPKMREFWFTDNRQATKWRYIRPARSALEYETATATAYRPQWKGFIDAASSDSKHYCLKFGIQALQSGMSVYLQCRYYMVFKNVR